MSKLRIASALAIMSCNYDLISTTKETGKFSFINCQREECKAFPVATSFTGCRSVRIRLARKVRKRTVGIVRTGSNGHKERKKG